MEMMKATLVDRAGRESKGKERKEKEMEKDRDTPHNPAPQVHHTTCTPPDLYTKSSISPYALFLLTRSPS
jgi:hypothetical protein